jgi:hypothetical protein
MPLRQQTFLQISQSEVFLSLGLFDKTNLQIVPKNGLLKCTSKLQVFFVLYKLKLQCNLSVLISVLCLAVILTVKL